MLHNSILKAHNGIMVYFIIHKSAHKPFIILHKYSFFIQPAHQTMFAIVFQEIKYIQCIKTQLEHTHTKSFFTCIANNYPSPSGTIKSVCTFGIAKIYNTHSFIYLTNLQF